MGMIAGFITYYAIRYRDFILWTIISLLGKCSRGSLHITTRAIFSWRHCIELVCNEVFVHLCVKHLWQLHCRNHSRSIGRPRTGWTLPITLRRRVLASFWCTGGGAHCVATTTQTRWRHSIVGAALDLTSLKGGFLPNCGQSFCMTWGKNRSYCHFKKLFLSLLCFTLL
jgi:hypothetical protein